MRKHGKWIVTTLIICTIILWVKGEFTRILVKDANYGMQAAISCGSIDFLFLGSSMFRQGIDIYELEEGYGENCYVLSYNGNQPASELLQLEYLLKHGVAIRTLYLDMYAYGASKEPSISDEKIFLEMDLKEKWKYWNLIRNTTGVGAEEFWNIFVTSNNDQLLIWPVNSYLINQRFHKGGNVAESASATREELEQDKIINTETSINDIQREAIMSIVQIARENQIRIVFIETPKYATAVQDNNYQGLMRQYLELLDELQCEYLLSSETAKQLQMTGKAVAFDSENPVYFTDSMHLSSEGRKAYTSELIKVMWENDGTEVTGLEK